jgi:tRNA threonylcarbamoyladenosine biosynthesis protein TsaE
VQLVVESVGQVERAAEKIAKFAGSEKIWLFHGAMGSGKTTLIKAIAKVFAIDDTVQSPTFSIVNEYRNAKNTVFYHFDFYRIKNEIEALDLGVNEYFDSGSHCFVEWPQNVSNLTPAQHLQIELAIASETGRVINLHHHGR